MPKKGMNRPDVTHTKERNEVPPVREIQGKGKANPLMETSTDNRENNLPEADVQDI